MNIDIHKINQLNWTKTNGLIPAIIQHKISGQILMHGFFNKESLKKTLKLKKVTFFSRTKNSLWTKGETTGNFLNVKNIISDCDKDSLLILVKPIGKTCHLNTNSCFKNTKIPRFTFLYFLENLLEKHKKKDFNNSYTYNLYKKGTKRISQKVGEEAIETILAANYDNSQEIINETSDLIYHLLVLLRNKNINFSDILKNLQNRNKNK
ncbi:bifunctional phosphoribosyl-AMP cyclohydrolase/phosphoribosyl-ATP diphosphatase HisIE [Enterobacteriaceae endosymbiont of Plateumaris consimilis]|uniref:bifunctional phosphoribosyl-AMP cyclohydrolase/phosphoribosyl-ATP diphosphatase HisIE n=1 Tax=Enterobacteriaceae endosymbiont of Plateumaris consimilis TaxID=2675794 RepID=UPI001448A71F|nr:bifunctional phosphoribosyl-AMP cyclohydrolase/phosphoribosyl-ATP diphosphatase HisIE [Enterobacteriaceae endosymbiont of Plateumaris consimilis]QJC28534.1 bifunctional phosphoribosyl-AMP cyclohydrolase/phosphoribosyl-ATP diphosphatase HisIE [Enterobacteriaceae endosymbiont of Plateumaris consimilis]